jgi:hypothetical protein
MPYLTSIKERLYQRFRDPSPTENDYMETLHDLDINANVKEVLARLKKNRTQHSKIVAEARKGYMREARKALDKRLKELDKGQLVELRFSLQPPADHTKAYDLAIQMLELHTGDQIELNALQVRHFMMDDWSWAKQFLVANAPYSNTAKRLYDSQ